MPTPIGHALGGLIVGLVAAGRSGGSGGSGGSPSTAGLKTRRPCGRTPYQPYLTMCAIAACLPDLDFLWGRHNMETHSLGFAVLVGIGVFAWNMRKGRSEDRPLQGTTSAARLALAAALAVVSHVLFDWLGSDDTPPLGVMALWPLSSEFYFANAFVFEAISRRYWLPNFITHNLLAVAREVAILLPIAAALWWWRGPRKLSNGTVEHM